MSNAWRKKLVLAGVLAGGLAFAGCSRTSNNDQARDQTGIGGSGAEGSFSGRGAQPAQPGTSGMKSVNPDTKTGQPRDFTSSQPGAPSGDTSHPEGQEQGSFSGRGTSPNDQAGSGLESVNPDTKQPRDQKMLPPDARDQGVKQNARPADPGPQGLGVPITSTEPSYQTGVALPQRILPRLHHRGRLDQRDVPTVYGRMEGYPSGTGKGSPIDQQNRNLEHITGSASLLSSSPGMSGYTFEYGDTGGTPSPQSGIPEQDASLRGRSGTSGATGLGNTRYGRGSEVAAAQPLAKQFFNEHLQYKDPGGSTGNNGHK